MIVTVTEWHARALSQEHNYQRERRKYECRHRQMLDGDSCNSHWSARPKKNRSEPALH
jgi:hypothetical protein